MHRRRGLRNQCSATTRHIDERRPTNERRILCSKCCIVADRRTIFAQQFLQAMTNLFPRLSAQRHQSIQRSLGQTERNRISEGEREGERNRSNFVEDRLVVLEQRPVEEMFDHGQIQDLISNGHAKTMARLNDSSSRPEMSVEETGRWIYILRRGKNPKGQIDNWKVRSRIDVDE